MILHFGQLEFAFTPLAMSTRVDPWFSNDHQQASRLESLAIAGTLTPEHDDGRSPAELATALEVAVDAAGPMIGVTFPDGLDFARFWRPDYVGDGLQVAVTTKPDGTFSLTASGEYLHPKQSISTTAEGEDSRASESC